MKERLSKALLSDNPRTQLEELDFWNDIPEIQKMKDVKLGKTHLEKDAYEHTMLVVEEASKVKNELLETYRLPFMLSALCHDLGKPLAVTEEDNFAHSYNHDILGITVATDVLKRFDYSEEVIDYVTEMVQYHMQPWQMYSSKNISGLRFIFKRLSHPEHLILLHRCDRTGRIYPNWYNIEAINTSCNWLTNQLRQMYV